MIVHTLQNVEPPARADEPWDRVRISGSSTASGSYTDIATQSLNPVDADPLNPIDRNITFLSDLSAGYFRLVFLDAGDNESSPSTPIWDDGTEAGPDFDWQPNVTGVGALLRARTKDSLGNELGTFTDKTRPTADDTEVIIRLATRAVATRLGASKDRNLCSQELKDQANGLTSLRAAMLVELSYFQEEVRTEQSPYDRYKALYDEDIAGLISAVERICGWGGDDEGTGGGGLMPVGSFPDEIIGFNQVW